MLSPNHLYAPSKAPPAAPATAGSWVRQGRDRRHEEQQRVVARREAVERQRGRLRGDLQDLLSERADVLQALAARRQSTPHAALGALQAQLDACQADLAVVHAELACLDGL